MKANATRLLEFMNNASQFIIPIYQRNYSWDTTKCLQLWKDIWRAGEDDAISGHFLGSIVYVEEDLGTVSLKSPLLVIDGQQRLTTITLLLAALCEAVGENEVISGFNAAKIAGYYLINPLESGNRKYRLLLSDADRDSLLHILDGPEPKEESHAIKTNFNLFREWVADCGDIRTICRGLQKLQIVDIALSRGNDNPQLIFESMNSTGMALSQADLIRNYLLMGLAPEEQEKFYKGFWRPMELDFGQEAYKTLFDSFIRHYLSWKTGDIPNKDMIYDEFKAYTQKVRSKGWGVKDILEDLRKSSRHFCNMAFLQENNKNLRKAFADLMELKVNVAFPMLLEWYDDYASGVLNTDDLLAAVRLVESYVFRRAVCGLTTNSLNKTFLIFNRSLDKNNYIESIKTIFALMTSYKRFPEDAEFRQALGTRNMFDTRRKYWAYRLENHNRKEPVERGEYSVEHIMPQKEKLSVEWKNELGPDWERVHEQYLHTIGNLTLTGYNSEYGAKSFAEKRDGENGFKTSTLKLNSGLGQTQRWNEDAIKNRTNYMCDLAVNVWIAPNIDDSILAKYKNSNIIQNKVYTLNDHPYLSNSQVEVLFRSLRAKILDLDESVSEEIKKHYIAYKAETNFIDIIPLAKSLKLILNMKFTKLDDPEGMAKDITNKGRWGNGDVEINFSKLSQLPYVINLVKQSLNTQIVDEYS